MPDPKPRKRGPSEYAEKDDKARQQAAEGRKPYLPPRKTRFLFKLVGLVLFALAAWLGYRFYKTGELPDVTSEEGQRKLAGDLKADVGKAADAAKPVVEEVASKVSEYVSYTLDNLRGKIKGKPPESKEEVKALVDESKQLADAKPPKPPGAPKAVEPPKPPAPSSAPRPITASAPRPSRRPRPRRASATGRSSCASPASTSTARSRPWTRTPAPAARRAQAWRKPSPSASTSAASTSK
ncbi:MAG: hypothetical protein M5U26_03230 [Planctomycetota bacterium]|nr:hypothetical protein [Planctomycetota bacterium]